MHKLLVCFMYTVYIDIRCIKDSSLLEFSPWSWWSCKKLQTRHTFGCSRVLRHKAACCGDPVLGMVVMCFQDVYVLRKN